MHATAMFLDMLSACRVLHVVCQTVCRPRLFAAVVCICLSCFATHVTSILVTFTVLDVVVEPRVTRFVPWSFPCRFRRLRAIALRGAVRARNVRSLLWSVPWDQVPVSQEETCVAQRSQNQSLCSLQFDHDHSA